MEIRRLPLFLLAALLMAIFSAYLFFQAFVQKLSTGEKVGIENECTDTVAETVKQENPNKMLFISCGGFLE